VRATSLSLRIWARTSVPVRRLRDGLFGALRVSGLLPRVYEPVYSERRLRYPAGAAAGPPCSVGARIRSADGEGMRLSNVLDALAYGSLGAAEPGMILLTVFADGLPQLIRAAARCAAGHPSSLVHRDAPRELILRVAGTSPEPHCRRPGFYLIRPDRIVAAHGHGPDLSVIRALLRTWDSEYHH
jgi:3-(3-hydroxy-phenyl)propionate hydroxylase